jgi:hypothetical protein
LGPITGFPQGEAIATVAMTEGEFFMACGDFLIMHDEASSCVRVPIGPFIRERFYAGETLEKCFADFEREYGRYGLGKGAPFNPLMMAAIIRRDWYRLKKLNRLPPGNEGLTLGVLLDKPRTAGEGGGA